MTLPASLQGRLRLPVVAAPMFLASGPALVKAACQSGIIGSFPSMNQRTLDGFEDWLCDIEAALSPSAAPFAVNLIVHKTNSRLSDDLERCVAHKVPIVITSFGAELDVVARVRRYGGVVLHDVISRRHAEKALAAGVDGLILVSAGAGGHAGTLNPMAFVREIRGFFDGCVLLSGGMADGYGIAAARALGADLAYLGTRFIATRECLAPHRYKRMILSSRMNDIVYTPNVSGVPANFMRASLEEAGLDPFAPPQPYAPDMDDELNHEHKAWRDIWSAGHGVGQIADIPPVADLVDQLERQYNTAIAGLTGH